jgi:hypothetical protein
MVAGASRRPLLVQSDSRTSAGTGDARAMGASDARGRDVGEAVIAARHPFAPLGTSGGLDRGAGRLGISSRTLRGSLDLLCKLRSLTRIECDDRVNVSRVKEAVDDWINQTSHTVEVSVPEVAKFGNALAGRPKWVAGRPHRETRSGAG